MKHSIQIRRTLLAVIVLIAFNPRVMGFYTPCHAIFRHADIHHACHAINHQRLRSSSTSEFQGLQAKSLTGATKYKLFKILRNKDANEISYDVNTDHNGKLVKGNPVEIYWVKYSSGGKKEQLNNIQRKYAYGILFTSLKEEEAVFRFVSYEKRTFTLKKDTCGTYRVYVKSMGKEVELNRIFIHVEGGTFWFPKITRVDLYGKDKTTGSSTLETIKP
jgi:hypothetical protein